MSERTTITETISLPPEVADRLRAEAEKYSLPKSMITRWALEHYFGMPSAGIGHLIKPVTKRKRKS